VRNDSLWTCQHIGLDGTDGVYDGDASGSSVDRSAVQWLRLHIAAGGASLSLGLPHRIRDDSSSNPYWYYFPSLTVNQNGDMVIGFSGSKATEYIGAFFSGRRASGAMPAKPVLVQAGRFEYTSNRWGDYSNTSLDPVDGVSVWTVQQFVKLSEGRWGTWVAKVKSNP
jgi:hypothetical protein